MTKNILVPEIRSQIVEDLKDTNVSIKSIATKYKIKNSVVEGIYSFNLKKGNVPRRSGNTKIVDQQLVLNDLKNGLTQAECAKKYGVSRVRIFQIKTDFVTTNSLDEDFYKKRKLEEAHKKEIKLRQKCLDKISVTSKKIFDEAQSLGLNVDFVLTKNEDGNVERISSKALIINGYKCHIAKENLKDFKPERNHKTSYYCFSSSRDYRRFEFDFAIFPTGRGIFIIPISQMMNTSRVYFNTTYDSKYENYLDAWHLLVKLDSAQDP